MRESYGVEGSGLSRLVRAAYDLLELITFFTAGEDKEAVARPLRRGSTAWESAATIHTEIQDEFIKAEVIGWHDLVEQGGYVAARDKGLLRIEGTRLRRRRRRRDHDQGLEPGPLGSSYGRRRPVPQGRRQGGPLRELLPEGLRAGRGSRRLDPPHRPQAPGRRAHRLDLVRLLRSSGRGAAGDQGDRARERALNPEGLVDTGRRRDHRAGPGRGLGRHRGARRRLVADLHPRSRAL